MGAANETYVAPGRLRSLYPAHPQRRGPSFEVLAAPDLVVQAESADPARRPMVTHPRIPSMPTALDITRTACALAFARLADRPSIPSGSEASPRWRVLIVLLGAPSALFLSAAARRIVAFAAIRERNHQLHSRHDGGADRDGYRRAREPPVLGAGFGCQ